MIKQDPGNLKYTTTKEAVEAHFSKCGAHSAWACCSCMRLILRRSSSYCPSHDTQAHHKFETDEQVKRLRFRRVHTSKRPTARPEVAPVRAGGAKNQRRAYCRRWGQERTSAGESEAKEQGASRTESMFFLSFSPYPQPTNAYLRKSSS